LAYGLPILTSVSGEMKLMLEENQCGEYYSNSNELVNLLLDYKNNPNKLTQHSRNARKLHIEKFEITKINSKFEEFINSYYNFYNK
jgi:glycosyltransferase involved in cell wall biosynthesis